MLIGSATRYLASRGAVQTVYWRSSAPDSNAQGPKIVKYGRFLSIAEKKSAREPTTTVAPGVDCSAGSSKRELLKAYAQQMYAGRSFHTTAPPMM